MLLIEPPDALVAQRADATPELGFFLGARRSYVYAVPTRALVRELDDYLQELRRAPWWVAMITRHHGLRAPETLSSAHLAD